MVFNATLNNMSVKMNNMVANFIGV